MIKIGKFLLFILAFSCNYQTLDKTGLKGRVKHFTEYRIKLTEDTVGQQIKYDTVLIQKINYNKYGQIDFSKYIIPAKLRSSSKMYYNSRNLTIKEVCTAYDLTENNKIHHFDINYTYTFKDSLVLKCTTLSTIDSLEYHTTEQNYYDSNNQITRQTNYSIGIEKKSRDTILWQKATFYYQSNKNLIKSISQDYNFYDSTMNSNTYIFTYDDSTNLLVKESEFDKNDTLKNTSIFKYQLDKNGSWIEKKEFDETGKLNYIYTRDIQYQ